MASVVIHLGHPEPMWDHAASRMQAQDNPKARMQAKGDVNYRKAEDNKRCGTCSHFSAQPGETMGHCALVAGSIDPKMVSDLWEAKGFPPQKAAGVPPK